MKKSLSFLRFVLFCLFFAVGTGAVALSVIADELRGYYTNKNLLKKAEAANEKIISLTAEYESQIRQIQNDPNVLKRLKLITLGAEPSAKNTAFPKASAEQLAAVKKTLDESCLQEQTATETDIPKWVKRSSQPHFRYSLFLAGAGLVLVTFIFFVGSGQAPESNEHLSKL